MVFDSFEEVSSLINALQLCVTVQIRSYLVQNDSLIINFEPIRKKEKPLEYFTHLLPGIWPKEHVYQIEHIDQIPKDELNLISQFLLLSRLQKKNILKLVEIDNRYESLVEKIPELSTKRPLSDIENVGQVSQIVFARLQEKKMTLRELAEKSGLTQVALSNFKSGKDIKLSNLLKISKALGLKLKLN